MTWERRKEMAGKYIPMAISRRRKARKLATVSRLVAPGRAVTQHTAMLADISSRQFCHSIQMLKV